MDFEKLLTEKECSCGMKHSCSIKKVIIGSGAIRQIGDLVAEYHNILLAADTNTYEVCGKEV